MGAKSITIVRAVTADFFFDVPSDEWIRDVPWCVHNHAQDVRLESLYIYHNSGHYPSPCLLNRTQRLETGLYLRLQVEHTQLGPIDRAILCLRTPVKSKALVTSLPEVLHHPSLGPHDLFRDSARRLGAPKAKLHSAQLG
jgi:hypothetical protein